MKKLILLLGLFLAFSLSAQQPARHTNGVVLGDPIGTSGDPTGVKEGQIYWNDTLGKFRQYNGTIWSDLTAAAAANEGYDESGTRAGGNLIVTIGDHDSSTNGTIIAIDDSTQEITIGNSSTNILIQNNLRLENGVNLRSYNNANTFYSDLEFNGVANRIHTLPDIAGTFVMLSNLAFSTIDEGNGIGYVVEGRTAANFGNVGLGASDLSFSNAASSTRGATGDYSLSHGFNTTASGVGSFASGTATTASNTDAVAMGQSTIASGLISTSTGLSNDASGHYSFVGGIENEAYSYAEFSIGNFGTTYIPLSPTTLNAADRLFNIGNGTGIGARADAFTVLKNGEIGIGIDNFEANTTGEIFQVSGSVKVSGATSYITLQGGATNTILAAELGHLQIETHRDADDILFRTGTSTTTKGIIEGDTGNWGLGRFSTPSRVGIYEDTATTGAETGVTIEQDGTGDALLHFDLTGLTDWTIGADNSSSDRFAISTGSTFTTTPALEIDTNDNVEIKKEVSADTTTAYELDLFDRFAIVTMSNASANTLTIPANSSVAFPVGTEIVIINLGVGVTTVAITTDTLNQNVGGLTLAQYDKRTLIKVTATTWIMGN